GDRARPGSVPVRRVVGRDDRRGLGVARMGSELLLAGGGGAGQEPVLEQRLRVLRRSGRGGALPAGCEGQGQQLDPASHLTTPSGSAFAGSESFVQSWRSAATGSSR